MTPEQLYHGVHAMKKQFYSMQNFSQLIHQKEGKQVNLIIDMMKTQFFSKIQFGYVG